MKKILTYIIVIGLGVLILLQFFQPPKNISPVTEDDFLTSVEAPEAIKAKIKVSCYDCHSNQTQYPWYNKVAPLSWLIAKHVKDGKQEMNLSNWGKLSKREQLGLLSGIEEVLADKSMPLESYLKLHDDAIFSDKETQAVIDWIEVASEKILE